MSLRYQQPDSEEWLAAKLSLEFLPERTLAPLALGLQVPAGPARFEHVAEAFAAAGIHGPARCEPQDLCGVVTVMRAWAFDFPAQYAQMAIDLYEKGQAVLNQKNAAALSSAAARVALDFRREVSALFQSLTGGPQPISQPRTQSADVLVVGNTLALLSDVRRERALLQ